MINAYVFYTDPILECVNLQIESSKNVQDLEIVPVRGEHICASKDLLGATHSGEYMKLMLSRWLKLPDIIRNNIGKNILFIDADIVFNEYKKNMVSNIETYLQDADIVTQFDTNSGMSVGVNMGFLGIKCNQKNLDFFVKFMDIISNIENPNPGFPQIEFNDYLKSDSQKASVKFCILPESYGYLTSNSYFYHAVNCGGNTKLQAMRAALEKFKQDNQ